MRDSVKVLALHLCMILDSPREEKKTKQGILHEAVAFYFQNKEELQEMHFLSNHVSASHNLKDLQQFIHMPKGRPEDILAKIKACKCLPSWAKRDLKNTVNQIIERSK